MYDDSITIKDSNLVSFIRISDFDSFEEKELSSAEQVRKMRRKESNRYKEEIDKALDELLKKPKSEWPRLLRK